MSFEVSADASPTGECTSRNEGFPPRGPGDRANLNVRTVAIHKAVAQSAASIGMNDKRPFRRLRPALINVHLLRLRYRRASEPSPGEYHPLSRSCFAASNFRESSCIETQRLFAT